MPLKVVPFDFGGARRGVGDAALNGIADELPDYFARVLEEPVPGDIAGLLRELEAKRGSKKTSGRPAVSAKKPAAKGRLHH